MQKKIIFGISGASGMLLAKTVLQIFSALNTCLDVHLIISPNALQTLHAECGQSLESWLSTFRGTVYNALDFSAGPASGSWQHSGMVICPCSMSSLAMIAHGCGTHLLHRSADVTLKEKRPLILVVRETPFSLVHLKNMQLATEAGAIIMPFMPAFYTGDCSLEGLMRHFAGRLLDHLQIQHNLISRWQEKH